MFGYLRDPPHYRMQRDMRRQLALLPAQALPERCSLLQYAAPVMDQDGTSACVGHGSAQGVYIAYNSIAAQNGEPGLSWVPSPKGIYTLARCASDVRPSADTPLVDEGAYPANAMWGITRYGVRPIQSLADRYSDCAPATINDEPAFDELETAGQKLLVGEYRIDEAASDVVGVVKQTLAVAQVPVGVGFAVDQTFMDGVGIIGAPTGNILGGHWAALIGYRPSSAMTTGEVEFQILNSWSTSWAMDGVGWVTEAWLRSAVSDAYAWTVRSAP